MKPGVSDYNRKRILEIFKIYREIDRTATVFVKENKVTCPEGCGLCCNNPEIEATTLEALPMAYYLLMNSDETINKILNELKDKSQKGVCIFFRKDKQFDWKGRCSVYKYRFTVCRLFGFYRRKDRHGELVTSACKTLKKLYPSYNFDESSVPGIADHYSRFLALGTEYETRLVHINLAVKNAIEYLQFDMMKELLKRK